MKTLELQFTKNCFHYFAFSSHDSNQQPGKAKQAVYHVEGISCLLRAHCMLGAPGAALGWEEGL